MFSFISSSYSVTHNDFSSNLYKFSSLGRNQKSPQHQSGVVYATSHRLFYVDNIHPSSRSFSLDLGHIGRTDFYAGLFRSSPKITLYLNALSLRTGKPGSQSNTRRAEEDDGLETWECEVCSYRNTSGLVPVASQVCSLCGVPRSATANNASTPDLPRQLNNISLSSSLPSSSDHLSSLASSEPISRSDQGTTDEVACPACTFLNHPSLPNCEICGTVLPRRPSRHVPAKSAPSSRPPSDDEGDDHDDFDDRPRMMKISFRKGIDKSFYAVLRRSLLGKAWVVSS